MPVSRRILIFSMGQEYSHPQCGKGGRSARKASWSQFKEVLRVQEKEAERYSEDNVESKNVTSGMHFRGINLSS